MCLISPGREFQTEGAAWKNVRCPNVLVFMCGMRGVLESEEERGCAAGVNLSGNELTLNWPGNTRFQSSQLAEPLWTYSGLRSGITVCAS